MVNLLALSHSKKTNRRSGFAPGLWHLTKFHHHKCRFLPFTRASASRTARSAGARHVRILSHLPAPASHRQALRLARPPRRTVRFFHHPTRRPPRAAGRKPRLPTFHLPTLEDRASIQRALAKVVSRVIGGWLDPAPARLIVFGLQVVNEILPGDPRQLSALIQQAQLALGSCSNRPPRRPPRQPPAATSGAQKMYRVQGYPL